MAGAWKQVVSATYLSLYEDCPRKWGYRYLEGREGLPSRSALLGRQVDDMQVQPYLRDGRPLDFTLKFEEESVSGDIVAAGLHLLPEPNPSATVKYAVQQKMVFDSEISNDFRYVGYADIFMPEGGLPGAQGGVPVIADVKTTGAWSYNKTPVTLGEDVQANIYAKYLFLAAPQVQAIDLGWIYFYTRKAYKAATTHRRLTRAENDATFAAIEKKAAKIVQLHKSKPKVLDLPANTSACEAYGGCPYKDICPRSPSQIIDAEAAGWLKQTYANQPKEKTTMANEPVVMTAPKLTGLAALKARADVAKGAATPAPAAPPPPAKSAPAPAAPAMLGVNPPESALPPAPAAGIAEVLPAAAPTETRPEPKKRGPKKTTEAPVQMPMQGIASSDDREEVTVTWGKETFTSDGITIEVGPFVATGKAREGESLDAALARLHASLEAVAEASRASKTGPARRG